MPRVFHKECPWKMMTEKNYIVIVNTFTKKGFPNVYNNHQKGRWNEKFGKKHLFNGEDYFKEDIIRPPSYYHSKHSWQCMRNIKR